MADAAVLVRPGRRSDVPAVDALLARSYPQLLKADYPPSVLVTAVPLISRAQPDLVACGTYYVAETEDGRIVGAGGWTPSRARARSGGIRHFVTDPGFTRRGVGSALMVRCLRDAARAGLRQMRCEATRTAVPFYRAHGFEVTGEIAVELRPGVVFPAIAMLRALP